MFFDDWFPRDEDFAAVELPPVPDGRTLQPAPRCPETRQVFRPFLSFGHTEEAVKRLNEAVRGREESVAFDPFASPLSVTEYAEVDDGRLVLKLEVVDGHIVIRPELGF